MEIAGHSALEMTMTGRLPGFSWVVRKCTEPQVSGWLPAVPICAPVGIRTPNLLIRSQMLYPLSYGRPSHGGPNDWSRIADPPGDAEISAAPRQRGVRHP